MVLVQQLTGLDAAFLALEDGATYGHVGSVSVLAGDPPLTLDRLLQHVDSRLHLLPPFRRRLAEVPLGLDQPYWVEDPDFDLEYHVRELALPSPGDDRQLAEQVARLHARHLDRRRPLWESYLVSGLSGGRQALYTKVHHAAIDGVAGNELLTALVDVTPEGRELPPAPAWTPDEVPGALGMLARGARSLAGHPARALRVTNSVVRSAPAVLSNPGRPRLPLLEPVVGRVLPRRGTSALLASAPLLAPPTPFNRPITPHRRWAFRTVPLADARAVKSAFGLTVNDVVMAMCAGALRRWLVEHDALPEDPLVAAVPVSVRSDADRDAGGNRVSAMLAALPTHLEDPFERLRAVSQATRAAKEQHQALPADLLADVTQFAMPAVAGAAARLSARLRLLERVSPFNLIVSNVPGPNVPLYLAGARLEALYPVSAIAPAQGLNITVLGYRGGLHFGLVSCRELVPDLDVLVDHLAEELATLVRLVPQASAS